MSNPSGNGNPAQHHLPTHNSQVPYNSLDTQKELLQQRGRELNETSKKPDTIFGHSVPSRQHHDSAQQRAHQKYKANLREAYKELASAIPLEKFWNEPNDPNRVNYELKDNRHQNNRKHKEPQQPGGR